MNNFSSIVWSKFNVNHMVDGKLGLSYTLALP